MVHVVGLKLSDSSISSVICWLAWVVVAMGTGSGMFTGVLLLAGAETVVGCVLLQIIALLSLLVAQLVVVRVFQWLMVYLHVIIMYMKNF